ncbi:amidohydrolase [Desulfovibrio sp. JY]|nr:amidohydrolase [Desulfovibrio sp. JY]
MILRNWPLASVAANTVTDLVVPSGSLSVGIAGFIICNTDSESMAAVSVTLADSNDATLGTLWLGSIAPAESVHIDTKIFLAASATPDKIRVQSDVAAVSFVASGVER